MTPEGLKHQGVLSDIANALPTRCQRPSDALPTGCVFQPPYPPWALEQAARWKAAPTPHEGVTSWARAVPPCRRRSKGAAGRSYLRGRRLKIDERKWRFRSRDSGFERVTPLRLYREIDGSSCHDAGAGRPLSGDEPSEKLVSPVIFPRRGSQISLGWLCCPQG